MGTEYERYLLDKLKEKTESYRHVKRSFLEKKNKSAANKADQEPEKDILEHYASSIRKEPTLKELSDYLDTDGEEDISGFYKVYKEADDYLSKTDTGNSQDIVRRLEEYKEEMRDILIRSNLRLVLTLSRKHVGYHSLEKMDIISYGNQGLIKAVEKYDPGMGFKFGTYASWWIRQSIERGIKDDSKTIRWSHHIWKDYFKVKQAEQDFFDESGRSAGYPEISKRTKLSEHKIASIDRTRENIASLEAKIGSDDGGDSETELKDMVKDELIEIQEENREKEVLFREVLERYVSQLPERSKRIIMMRENHTFREIAADLGMTRERVRQIYNQDIRIIKNRMSLDRRRKELSFLKD